MLRNNNDKILNRMAKRSFAGNKRRNLIMVFVVMLSVFMVFTILTVGITYLKMHELQNIRMNGADFDAIMLGGFTDKQKKQCEEDDRITTIGIEAKAAYAEKTDVDDTLHTIFVWADKTHWNKQKMPAVEKIEGSYPKKANEIMATREALKDCGKADLGVGDFLSITYKNKSGSHTGEFKISGIWNGYGDKKVFYVSQSFFEQSGYLLSDKNSGILYLDFKSAILPQKQQEEIRSSLELGRRQRLFFDVGMEMSVDLLLGTAGLILMTCLSAYLLIYNIQYLSVSGNIRYYGLLQTVGMTGRQIRGLMWRQMILIFVLGIGCGLILGAAASFFIIPGIVKNLGIREEVKVVFHPAVFLLSVLVAGLTVYLGSRKPAKTATAVSPVEALGYRPLSGQKSSHRTGKRSLLWRMAAEQFTKNKKKTGLIVVSLTVSLTVFLCLTTMIDSHGARNYVSNFMNADLVIDNDTMRKENREDWVQILDDGILEKFKTEPSVKEVHPMSSTPIIVPWEPGFADTWMRKFYEMWMDQSYEKDIEEYKQHPEKFYSFLNGIDEKEFDYLNSTLKTPVDKKAFMKGDVCIIYRHDLELQMSNIKDKKLSFILEDDPEKSYELQIGGLTEDSHYVQSVGMAPVALVSQAFIDRIVEEPYICRTSIWYDEEYDEAAEASVKGYIEEGPYAADVSYDSKIDTMKSIRKAQGNMMLVGMGIALILALIGIMNYVNTVTGNIQNRLVEVSIMESVGMTEQQIYKMLLREGLLFAGSSLLLAATAGLGITYVCYQTMNYMGVAFAVPALPVVVMTVLTVAVCVTVPPLAYRMISGKMSIVERIRGFE